MVTTQLTMKFFVGIILTLFYYTPSFSYTILAVFPHDGKSHQWVFEPLIKELVYRGHNITVVAHYSFGIDHSNFTEILLNDDQGSGVDLFPLEYFDHTPISQLVIEPFILFEMGMESCRHLFARREVNKLMQSEEEFDILILEMFNNECGLAFVDKFNAPFIGISSSSLMPWLGDRFGQPDDPHVAYVSELCNGKSSDLIGRLINFVGNIWYKSKYWFTVRQNQLYVEQVLKKKMPSFQDIMRNTTLILTNSHLSLHFSKPLVPAIVEVGGIHIRESSRLPRNIEKFINESTHGVIYFSLGSMIKGHTFPQEKREEFLRAFARLPQRVLWKWENETMPGKPDNVMIQKWMPQFDILSHPNVKAFISHGGLLGVTEAVHCGVPMMVMPQYGDQHTNAKAVEANGGGVILYLKDATEEKVYQNLKTILSPEFKAKASALSERFRDRPMSPMDTAIYWVEYVARHKGAPHLKTAAVDMPLYQYLLLDVLAFLAAIILVVLYILYKITCLIFRALFSKKKVKQN